MKASIDRPARKQVKEPRRAEPRAGALVSANHQPGGSLDPAGLMELQRLAGNASVTALVETAQREAVPGAVAEAPVAVAAPDPVAEVVAAIVTAASPLAGTPEMHGIWEQISYQFTNRHASASAPSKKTGAAVEFTNFLHGKDLARRINKLRPAQKQQAMSETFDALAAAADHQVEKSGGTGGYASVADEFQAIAATSVGNYLKTEAAYRGVRSGLLGRFGAAEVGTAGAIKNADTYYAGMVPIDTFFGRKLGWTCQVHDEMAKAIGRAEAKLVAMQEEKLATAGPAGAASWAAEVRKGISNFGDGVSIRANANSALALSLHSYGWAIDVNAAFNPNVPKFPRELVSEMTGVDVFQGSTGQAKGNFARGKSAAEVGAEAERLRQASQKFAGAFESESSLKAAMLRITNGRLYSRWGDAEIDTIFPLAMAGAEAGLNIKKKSQREAAQASARDALTGQIRTLQETVGPQVGVRAGEFQRLNLATTLIKMADIYRTSWTINKKTHQPERVKAQARLTNLGSIAAHGFMNLDADLTGALAGSDAGGLNWLGAVDESNTKDFMHFELPVRPALY